MITALDLRGTLKIGLQKRTFQKVRAGLGNISNGGRFDRQERAHVIPLDPNTALQQQNRARLAAATAAWHLLTTIQKDNYKKLAGKRQISGFNYFISGYIKATPLQQQTLFDGGITSWDGGSTTWI